MKGETIMIKRCLFLLLAIVVCFTFSPEIAVSAAIDDKTNEPLENLTYMIPVTEEYMEKVFGAPEEILNGSTEGLLEYFLNSMFLDSRTLPLASSTYVAERSQNADYTAHAAFRELMTRSDLTSVLANSVRSVYYEKITDEYMIEKLRNVACRIPGEVIASFEESDEEISSTKFDISSICNLSSIPGGLLNVPEDILEGSTEELLNYFRETYDMWIGVHERACDSLSSCISDPNYYNNGAFCELITRADLCDALLNNLADINEGYYVDAVLASTNNLLTSAEEQIKWEKHKLQKLVDHIPDTTIITAFADTDAELVESYSTIQTRESEYYGSLNGVDYYTADPIITPNGNSVLALVAVGELPMSAYTRFLVTATTLNVTITDYPTGDYNCHSYAWYNRSYNNNRWIDYISGFRNDESCVQIADDYIQEGDIFVYYDENGTVLHSGIVTEITDNIEELVITSKWGQGVACIHSIQNVPDEYLAYYYKDRDHDGVIEENEVSYSVNGAFFRYPTASTSSASSNPYTELDESVEIVAALPVSMSYDVIGDEDFED